jgi:hypothetical protein
MRLTLIGYLLVRINFWLACVYLVVDYQLVSVNSWLITVSVSKYLSVVDYL